jgi:putative membrane protein
MRFWCSAVEEPWSWTPRPYVGVWLLVFALAAGYWTTWRRHHGEVARLDGDRRYMWRFAGGLFFLWVASDWPVGTLGGGYLASVHMLQWMLYTFAAAPLLMLGTPEWMASAVLDRLRFRNVWMVLSRPLVAFAVGNVILVATHSPWGVDFLRASQVGSFLMDMIWLFAGLVLWAPVINPIREAVCKSDPIRIVYLFFAVAIMPMIPGAFITFSPTPLYETYELAPRVGLSPVHDQQLAGVVMKLGSIPIVWSAMGVIWFRWYQKDNVRPAHRRQPVRRTDVDLGDGSDTTGDDHGPPTTAGASGSVANT